MTSSNCTVGFSAVDTADSICAIHNSGNATSQLQKCCGNAPVQITADGCERYCQYDSTKLSDFEACLGGGSYVEAMCQGAKNSSSPSASSSPTSTHSNSPIPSTGFASPRYSWSKSVMALMVMALAAPALSRQTPKQGNILSCVDGQCNNCTTGNDVSNPNGPSSWGVSAGWPACEIYNSVAFNGAESKTGGGYDVWWDIAQPDPGCQIIIMSPVGQDVAGTNCGNIVLSTKHAGCLYAHLKETFMVQFCCGSGDCAGAGVGGTKRDVLDYPTLAARARNGELGDETFAASMAMNGTEPISRFSLKEKRSKQIARSLDASPGNSLTARAARFADAALRPRDDSKCSPAHNKGDSYTKSGGQIQLTDVLTCGSTSPCNQQIGKQISVSHTLTSQHSNTFTVSGGVAVSVEVGTDFIIEAKSTVQVHAEVARSVEDSTGTSDTKTATTTINQVYSQVPGTSGYIWFTPTLNCQKKTMTCGQQGVEVEQCDPALLADGSQKGELGFTSVD